MKNKVLKTNIIQLEENRVGLAIARSFRFSATRRPMQYSLVPNIQSASRQWPLLPVLLPDILFLGRH